MVSSVKVKVDGLQDLQRRLRALSEKVQKKVARSATNAAAQVIKKQAIRNAPRSDGVHILADTEEGPVDIIPGNLRKGIIVARVRNTPLTSEHLVTVGGKAKHHYAARYAHFVEFGTIRYAPRPFLRPAFDQEKGFAVGAMKVALEKGIIKEPNK